jgi:hypothetical protein
MTTPTQAERDFTLHWGRELLGTSDKGPAYTWLRENGISYSSMIAFGYWEQRNNELWLDQLIEDQPPPFRVPWSSREEFLERVKLFLEDYPDLDKIVSVTPYEYKRDDPHTTAT